MAHQQAEGNPKGTGGITTCGPLLALECQAREPASTVVAGVGKHRATDEEEGLDRSATEDDETGGASTWGSWARGPAAPRRGHVHGSDDPPFGDREQQSDLCHRAGATATQGRDRPGARGCPGDAELSPLDRPGTETHHRGCAR